MGSKRLDSVHDFARWRLDVVVTCMNCKHEATFAPRSLMDRLGYGHLSIFYIEKRMRCSRCGRKKAAISASEQRISG